ncbi:MAG: acetyl-CoA C-acetyltransferase [Planctomycetota bacterium]
METVVIVSAVRTPIGRFLGSLKDVPAVRLGSLVVAEALRRASLDPGEVDEVILGNVVSAGLGQNPARQAALGAGLPDTVAALTINKVCGSGLKAVVLAAQAVALGDARIVIAGGMESMSKAPYLLQGARTGLRLGHGKMLDAMIHDGLWDAYEDYHMGNTGEVVAQEYGITRQAQDEWALSSHRKALAAIDAGKFQAETIAVEVPQRKGDPVLFEVDESPRADSTLEALSKLRPAFRKDGTVTAGNAPGVNDGAAALVVTSAAEAQRRKLQPLARIVAYATSGIAPRLVMMAPERAVRMVLDKTGWSMDEVDLFEFNEAFAVQQCALVQELKMDAARVNVHGGAVALGHPIGASGARILTTLLHALQDRGLKRGIAALCLGGGNAVAMAVERG